ncbi:MAG: hypothetical protein DWQ06_03750 [Calditrichaeota bacterium]|nr:MAG: hypothetical protein DWQ06_03750 [Calditrichota bacterium]
MNKQLYFNYINNHLHNLSRITETNGKLHILDLHTYSEYFYRDFLNLVYGYELKNLNDEIANAPAIDLIDHKDKVVIQVSATCTKEKIETALQKEIIQNYPDYTFNFISIAKDASNLRSKTFQNPHNINFNPSKDIHDIKSILQKILSKTTPDVKIIYQFIKVELGKETDYVKLDSNLATIINILAEEDWSNSNATKRDKSFDIEKKIDFNNLVAAKKVIEFYSLHSTRVDEKYSEFDKLGKNKSQSVLGAISNIYLKLTIDQNKSADQIFFAVTESVMSIVLESLNFTNIPIDELELSVDILVVDAFIRCKIFENPEGYKYVTSR